MGQPNLSHNQLIISHLKMISNLKNNFRKDIGGKDGCFFYLKFLWEGILSDVLTILKCKDSA